MKNLKKSIYSMLVDAGRPFKLPGHWEYVPCDPELFCLPSDPAPLLADLRQQFSDAELLRAGVVVGGDTHQVQWHPSLLGHESPIWTVRPVAQADPQHLIAGMRALGDQPWPLPIALGEHRQHQLIDAGEGSLVVAYSMADLAILRSLNIAAVPGDNWSPLSRSQLIDLCRGLRISEQQLPSETIEAAALAEQTRPAAKEVALTLANWSLSNFNRNPLDAATSTWAHLADLHKHLDLSFDSLGCWTPSKKVMNGLLCQARYHTVDQLRASLLNSIAQDSLAIDAKQHAKTVPAKSIPEALLRWRRSERDAATSPAARKQFFEHVLELYERQRFTPLVEAALQADCPVERSVTMNLAEIGRLLQPQLCILAEQARHRVGEKGKQSSGAIPADEFKQLLTLLDHQLKLTEVVLECRNHRSRGWTHKPASRRQTPTKPSSTAGTPPRKSTPLATADRFRGNCAGGPQ